MPTVMAFGLRRSVVQQEAKRLGLGVRGKRVPDPRVSGPIGGGQLSAHRASGAPGQGESREAVHQ